MKANLTVIDDFLHDPKGVRDFALGHDFSQVPVYDGHEYPGFAPVKDGDRVKAYLGGRISQAIGGDVAISMACVVKGTEGFSTQQWIHADNGCGGFAGVLYLFDRPGYGTAFWRHKETKADGLAEYVKFHEGAGAGDIAGSLQAQGQTQSAWDRTDYVESQFNRLIIYPTDRFHSRWPEKAFGTKPDDCRLTMSIFFNFQG